MPFWPPHKYTLCIIYVYRLYIIYPKQMQFWPQHYIPPLVTYKDTQQFVFGINT